MYTELHRAATLGRPFLSLPDALPAGPGLEAATVRALVQGGDARIALGADGRNRYGCAPRPDAHLVALGSSTASVISHAGFRSAMAMHCRLQDGEIEAELSRLRMDLMAFTGASRVAGTGLVLAASGTDLHLIATQLARRGTSTVQAVMADACETGSGVPQALAGRHFGDQTCLGQHVTTGAEVHTGSVQRPLTIALRERDGAVRASDDIDADFVAAVARALQTQDRCLLVMTDLSKTGLQAPSADCVQQLQSLWGERLDVMVDACQFRMSRLTVAHCLQQGWMVALTGSKFVTGPAFCGALLLPPALVDRSASASLEDLKAYSSPSDWPAEWPAAQALEAAPNLGLWLRWEAALTELRRFSAVPDSAVKHFLDAWGAAMAQRIADDPCLEALPVPALQRGGPETAGWDRCQTIFPFLVSRREAGGQRRPLSTAETLWLHRQMLIPLAEDHASFPAVQLGQPVACGQRGGVALSALRLCASARLVSDFSRSPDGLSLALTASMRALDKLSWLAGQLDEGC